MLAARAFYLCLLGVYIRVHGAALPFRHVTDDTFPVSILSMVLVFIWFDAGCCTHLIRLANARQTLTSHVYKARR